MTGASATRTNEAADALLEWLSAQPARSTAPPADAPPETAHLADELEGSRADLKPDPRNSMARQQGGPPSDCPATPSVAATRLPMRLPTPDWLHHRLAVSGPTAEVSRFRQASAGAGIIPWQLDLDRLEQDYFHLLVAAEQRSLSVAGARIFARQLRDAVARRHELAVSRAGSSRACSFDLHALVPVPHQVLLLGPDEPNALAWLWEHWGTTQALRHVAEDVGRSPAKPAEANVGARFVVRFWSADWTPWRALVEIKLRWPAVRFELRPDYDLP